MLKEKGPKISRVTGLKKFLSRLESGALVLDRKRQSFLPGGIMEDDLDSNQMKEVVRMLIKEDAEKPVETNVAAN